jgi:hypothetical protein
MSRRLDFEKASRNHQAKYGLSVKDEAEWMENDAAARWLTRNENRASQKLGYRPSPERGPCSGMQNASTKKAEAYTCRSRSVRSA